MQRLGMCEVKKNLMIVLNIVSRSAIFITLRKKFQGFVPEMAFFFFAISFQADPNKLSKEFRKHIKTSSTLYKTW